MIDVIHPSIGETIYDGAAGCIDINDLEFDGRKAALNELNDLLTKKHTITKNLFRQVMSARDSNTSQT